MNPLRRCRQDGGDTEHESDVEKIARLEAEQARDQVAREGFCKFDSPYRSDLY